MPVTDNTLPSAPDAAAPSGADPDAIVVQHEPWCPVEAHGDCCLKADDPDFYCDCGAIALQHRIDLLRDRHDRYRAALEQLAANGGWKTDWVVDEADGTCAPSTFNAAEQIARHALDAEAGS